jgi:hypothetical protein
MLLGYIFCLLGPIFCTGTYFLADFSLLDPDPMRIQIRNTAVYWCILVSSTKFNLTTDIGRMERLRGGCALGGGVAAALQNWLQTALAVQVIVVSVFMTS